jgi:hypothetical protein
MIESRSQNNKLNYMSKAEALIRSEAHWAILSFDHLTERWIVEFLLRELIEKYIERNEV